MARKTKEEAEATREAILEAASITFMEEGVANASLEGIACKAGVTRGAVYWHFKNKKCIVAALHDQLYTPFTEALMHDLENDHPQPLKQLQDLFTHLLLDLEQNAQKKRALTIFFLKCDYSGEFKEFLECQNRKKEENIRLFAQYFERAKKRGHLPKDTDTNILTLSFICYITGLAYEYLRNPSQFSLKKQAPYLVGQFFSGCKG